jgi:hypothetical protein
MMKRSEIMMITSLKIILYKTQYRGEHNADEVKNGRMNVK